MKELENSPRSHSSTPGRELYDPRTAPGTSPPPRKRSKYTAPFLPVNSRERREFLQSVAEENQKLQKEDQFFERESQAALYGSKEWMEQKSVPDFLDDALGASLNLSSIPPEPHDPNLTLETVGAAASTVSSSYGWPMLYERGTTTSIPPQVTQEKNSQAESEYDLMDKAASMVPFVVNRHSVYLYNGVHYEAQSADEVEGVILDLCREDAIRIGKYSPIKNACKLIKIDKRFQSPQEWLDAGKRYVTFLNGNLGLDTGQLLPHSPSIFTTFCVQANYLGPECGVETPVFDQVLLRAGGGDPWFVERVFQMFGYVFTADIQGKCGFLLQGVTNSGKSLLCNFLSSFFPEDKVAAISLHSVGDRFSTAELEGAALCITPDLPSSPLSEKAAGMVKALTGNDLIQADRKYQKHTKFRFEGKFLMGTNHALLTKDYDPAFADRLVVLPFLYSIPRAEWDSKLLDRLKLERDAVASKAMDAYFRLCQANYVFAGDYALNLPAAVGRPVQCQYMSIALVDQYVRTCYEPSPSGRVFVSDAYSDFCLKSGSDPDSALFGKYFIEAAGRCFGAAHERRRRVPGGNPISSVVGLQHKFEGGEHHAEI